jgi:hypothetical protein
MRLLLVLKEPLLSAGRDARISRATDACVGDDRVGRRCPDAQGGRAESATAHGAIDPRNPLVV